MLLNSESQGTGEPLIILHGLFGSLDNWKTISRSLASDFQVHALDQRNHGRSPHAPKMNYSLMAQDVAEWMQHQRIESAHLLGHSMGGKTAMQLALSRPAMIRKLVVADIAPRGYPPRHRQILDALLSLDLSALRSRAEAEQLLTAGIPDLETRRFLLKNLRRRQEGGFEWQIDLGAINQEYPNLNAAIVPAAPFEKPALFLRGGKSDYVQPQDEPSIRGFFPLAELLTFPNVGHWLHAEIPEEFVRKVREFLLR